VLKLSDKVHWQWFPIVDVPIIVDEFWLPAKIRHAVQYAGSRLHFVQYQILSDITRTATL